MSFAELVLSSHPNEQTSELTPLFLLLFLLSFLPFPRQLDLATSQIEVGARWLPQIVEAFQLYPFSVAENQHLDLLNVVQETSAWAGYMRSRHGATFLKIAMESMLESKYFSE